MIKGLTWNDGNLQNISTAWQFSNIPKWPLWGQNKSPEGLVHEIKIIILQIKCLLKLVFSYAGVEKCHQFLKNKVVVI